jgi:hypothetical protein
MPTTIADTPLIVTMPAPPRSLPKRRRQAACVSTASRRVAALNLTAPAESDLAEELAQHLENQYRDLTAAGMAPDDAYRQVLPREQQQIRERG